MKALPTYVINLDRRPDRWQAVQDNVRDYLGASLTRVVAVDGRTVDSSLLDMGEQTLLGRHEEVGFATPGTIGCYMSHTNVWSSFLESGAEYATVLEDDAYFDRNSEATLNKAMEQAKVTEKPYDAFMLGILAHRGDKEDLGENAFRLKGRWWGTQGYVMNRKFAKEMLAAAFPMRHQVDAYLGEQVAKRDDLRVLGARTVVKQGLMGTDVQSNFWHDFSEQVLEHGHEQAYSLLQKEAAASPSWTDALLSPIVSLLQRSGALGGMLQMYGLNGQQANYDVEIYGLFNVVPYGMYGGPGGGNGPYGSPGDASGYYGSGHGSRPPPNTISYPFLMYGQLSLQNVAQQLGHSLIETTKGMASSALQRIADMTPAPKPEEAPLAPPVVEPVSEPERPLGPGRVQMVVRPEASQGEVVARVRVPDEAKVRRQTLDVISQDE